MDSFNTGMQRAVKLVVEKKINGIMIEGYPHVYSLADEFLNYAGMTESEFSFIPVEPYKERLRAFKQYVESIEMGVSVNINEAYVENTGACPLPEIQRVNRILACYHWSADTNIIHKISLQSDIPVASDIKVEIISTSGDLVLSVSTIQLKEGESYAEIETQLTGKPITETVTPTSDYAYEYQIFSENITE